MLINVTRTLELSGAPQGSQVVISNGPNGGKKLTVTRGGNPPKVVSVALTADEVETLKAEL